MREKFFDPELGQNEKVSKCLKVRCECAPYPGGGDSSIKRFICQGVFGNDFVIIIFRFGLAFCVWRVSIFL
jgi:hypothetical protein